MDQLFQSVCDVASENNVLIFTIALDNGNAVNPHNLISSCTEDNNGFSISTSGNNLERILASIASTFSDVRFIE